MQPHLVGSDNDECEGDERHHEPQHDVGETFENVMLRGCEHRSGLRLGDIVTIEKTHVVVAIAERRSERKKKMVPGRQVVLPISEHRWSAGAALSS